MKILVDWLNRHAIILNLLYVVMFISGIILVYFNRYDWNIITILGLVLFLLGTILWAISLFIVIKDGK